MFLPKKGRYNAEVRTLQDKSLDEENLKGDVSEMFVWD